jgi:hypothetical protein
MPKRKVTPTQEPPTKTVADGVTPEQNGRRIPPEAAALMAEMAARGRARRQKVEAEGTPPWEAAKKDPEWQKRWDEVIAQIRSEIPPDVTPEEIEAEITRVSEELRQERLARGR